MHVLCWNEDISVLKGLCKALLLASLRVIVMTIGDFLLPIIGCFFYETVECISSSKSWDSVLISSVHFTLRKQEI